MFGMQFCDVIPELYANSGQLVCEMSGKPEGVCLPCSKKSCHSHQFMLNKSYRLHVHLCAVRYF